MECGESGTCWRCRALELGLEISGCHAGWSRTQQVPPALPLNAQPWADYLPGRWKGRELPLRAAESLGDFRLGGLRWDWSRGPAITKCCGVMVSAPRTARRAFPRAPEPLTQNVKFRPQTLSRAT